MACRLLNIVEQHVIADDGALDARPSFVGLIVRWSKVLISAAILERLIRRVAA